MKVFESLEDVDVSGELFQAKLPLGPQDPGLAHIVEHLAFNGTEKYSNHEIVRFLEKIGAEFGACQNAYTSSDETVYQLVLPCDDPALLGDALSVLSQFAFHIRCAEGDLAKERGAVLEEARMSRDAAGRMQEAHWKLIFKGSKYADRLPIGKDSVIKGAPAALVKAFYERWYRPESMAVVVVGDFEDADAVVSLIQTHLALGASRSLEPAPALPSYSFAPHAAPRFGVLVDRESSHAGIFVSFKHVRQPISTPAEFLRHLEDSVFQIALGSRLFRLSRDVDPPLHFSLVQRRASERHRGKPRGVLRALESLLTEVARVRLHGFSVREIDRAKSELMADVENNYLERDQGYCWDIRDEYLRHFLNGEFVTGMEYEARLSKTLLPSITRESVETRASQFAPDASCVVKVVLHKASVTEEQLAQVVARVAALEASKSIPAQEEMILPDEIMAVPAPTGSIVSEREYEVLGGTELLLGNGMRVFFKSTVFQNDEILVTGIAHGGMSEVPRELFVTASMSSVIAGQLGVFGHKPEIMDELLAGKRVGLEVSEGAYSRSFTGVQSPCDLDTAMQLIHLLFTTNVTVNRAEVSKVMEIVKQGLDAQMRSPSYDYGNRLRAINFGDCYYFDPITHETFATIDAHVACAHHTFNYRNPAQFKVVFTGNVTRETFLPLVETYLASIPTTALPPPIDPINITPLKVSFPAEPVIKDIQVDMVSPIGQTQITLPVMLVRGVARVELVWLSLGCRLLETRLLQRLRFQFGEVYTVSVAPFFGCEAPSNTGDLHGSVSISFTCDPANKDRLIAMALDELSLLQMSGPTQEEINTLKVLEEFDTNSMRMALQRLFPYPCTTRYTAITMIPQSPSYMQRFVTSLYSSSLGSRSGLLLLAGGAAVLTLTAFGLWSSQRARA
ncbi:MAG: hypothetical protein WDW38_010898 [Sanguina aurantia]